MTVTESSTWTARPLRWMKVGASFASLQLAIQGLNFLIGWLIIRVMDKQDYALVTIAITMLGTMATLSNMGITIAISSIGGRIYADRVRFGSLIRSVLKMRWLLALITVPVVTTLLTVMLVRNQATTLQIAVIIAMDLLWFLIEMRWVVLAEVLYLHSQSRTVQLFELSAGLVRMALIAALVPLNAVTVAAVLIIGVIASLQRNWRIERRIHSLLDLSAPEVAEDRREIVRLIRLQALNSVFFCIQGQLAIWIVSFVSGRDQVADIGAIGRFAVVVNLFSAYIGMVLVPGFARLHDLAKLKRHYLAIWFAAVALSLAFLVPVWLFPRPFLWILGEKYMHLTTELPLMLLGNLIGFLTGTSWKLNTTKGWITLTSYLNIPATIITQVVLALYLDLSTLRGALLLAMIPMVLNLLLCLADAWWGFRKLARTPAGPGSAAVPP